MKNVTRLLGSEKKYNKNKKKLTKKTTLLICGLTLATDSHTFIHYFCVCVYVRDLTLKGNLTLFSPQDGRVWLKPRWKRCR